MTHSNLPVTGLTLDTNVLIARLEFLSRLGVRSRPNTIYSKLPHVFGEGREGGVAGDECRPHHVGCPRWTTAALLGVRGDEHYLLWPGLPTHRLIHWDLGPSPDTDVHFFLGYIALTVKISFPDDCGWWCLSVLKASCSAQL